MYCMIVNEPNFDSILVLKPSKVLA